jgi:hypothetical protein
LFTEGLILGPELENYNKLGARIFRRDEQHWAWPISPGAPS